MYSTSDYLEPMRHIEETGIVIMRNISRFSEYNTDIVSRHITLILCHRGSSHGLYDLQKATHYKNDLGCILPGHIHHPIESSEDYLATIVMLSQDLFKNLQFHLFSHDYDKFNIAPICHLTEQQAQRMMGMTDQLEAVVNHTEEDLPHRRKMIFSLLAVGYEFLNFFRRDQDREWSSRRHAQLYRRFCDLVVTHYTESREVRFYADLLHLTPKHFTKIIRQEAGGITPAEWIEQYVAAQAKNLIETRPDATVQEIAYTLGFSEPTTFHRYFKRVTGLTATEYKKNSPKILHMS